MSIYIHQLPHWPQFTWDSKRLINLLGEARLIQGMLLGKMETLGFELKAEAMLDTMTLDVIKSSEIEGQIFDLEQVRSSIARRLGIQHNAEVETSRNLEGMVEMLLDATQQCSAPLSAERLFDWHAALFPTARNGMFKIIVGDWRKDLKGPMQVVSGAIGKEQVHFQAPAANLLENEMLQFIQWFNHDKETDLVLKAGIAHLWFVTIHPFEDGNGRIARALADMLLAQSDNSPQRFYSMSAQIRLQRKHYYNILESTQKGNLDITNWLVWFLECLIEAIKASESTLNQVLLKAAFWRKHATTPLNPRQQKMLNKLLDGMEGKLHSAKWAKMAKCSRDTAIRDINDLLDKAILTKENAGGRSTSYVLSE